MDERKIDRRIAVASLALCALAPGMIGENEARAAARMPIAVPPGEWILTRTVERGLGKGAKITVTRAWQVRFARSDGGMSVTGRQISVTVEAPPRLAALAEIERNRKADELFPAQLDPGGRIARMADGSNPADVARAVDTALEQLKHAGDHGQSYDDHRSFLLSVNRMAANEVSRIPPDLFFPEPGTGKSDRAITLANGETGHVMVIRAATTHAGSALLARSERRIITTIGDEERVSSESWMLAPVK